MKTYFYGGCVVLPDRVVTDMAVVAEGERIVGLIPVGEMPADAERVDLDGGYLLPGFVDIHVHGGGGADLMDATPEAVRRMAQLHCAHGTTAMCPTTMTCPTEQLLRCIDAYREAKEQ
ncbi:MAG: amidohydrolase family protein, partial [Clostridia bacterium]|nr:amidohydrolase family protein [Clostridia bacterium]